MEELKPILRDSNLIGKGDFTEVYKGVLDDAPIVVKKPISGNGIDSRILEKEVIIQSQLVHKNIVSFIGYCVEMDKPMLVYEFIDRGSLDDMLHRVDKEPLNLDVRLTVVAESAQGLAYLHCAKIRHGNVKPANILLCENFMPKISGFFISRLVQRNDEYTAHMFGSLIYTDPVYIQTYLLTQKSDVYSFGVVILEVISRKKASTHSDYKSLVRSFLEGYEKGKNATELFDKEIAVTTEDLKILDSLAKIAVDCLNLDVDQRPMMADIAERLVTLQRYHRSQVSCQ
jgi:serine/threonine protein kinase